MTKSKNVVFEIASAFRLPSRPMLAKECTVGHINSTYFITCDDGSRYVLQRINTTVFKDPDVLMKNVVGVTEYIRNKLVEDGGDATRGTIHFRKTEEDKYYFVAKDGSCWRMYDFVANVETLDAADSPRIFENVGYAFGHFQMQLADYDATALRETIPNFHNTVSRYNDLLTAVEKNTAGRLSNVADEIAFVSEREGLCSYITQRISNGKLPLRVTHNDTKLNNILMDITTHEPVCVIDLDTIMPGSVLYDFGDAIRFGASSAAEDETDLSRVYMRTDMFDAFAKGFVSGLEGSLSREEIMELPMGAIVITLETGIRFLTDYLNGDTYFRIHYPGQNLDRARNQFKLVQDMEEKLPQMKKLIEKYL